jgi:hypothetical protein
MVIICKESMPWILFDKKTLKWIPTTFWNVVVSCWKGYDLNLWFECWEMNRIFLKELYLGVNFFILLEGEVLKQIFYLQCYLRVFFIVEVVVILKRWVVFILLFVSFPLLTFFPYSSRCLLLMNLSIKVGECKCGVICIISLDMNFD